MSKTYLVSYPLKGARYQTQIVADSLAEADEHVRALMFAKIDGELKAAIPVPFGGFFRWLFGRKP